MVAINKKDARGYAPNSSYTILLHIQKKPSDFQLSGC